MSDHDRFCPEYMQYADPCPICIVIASARADERERVCAYIRDGVERLTGKMIHRNHVLFLLDEIDGGSE